MIQQPFSYYGGKQRIASKIIPYIPKHTVYAEPFCGGATILFKKPWPTLSAKSFYREYINDANELVINFFRQLRDNGKELCKMLSIMPLSEKEHELAKHPENEPDDLMRAYYFFTNIQQSFSNKLNGGWGRAVIGSCSQIKWMRKTENLGQFVDRMQSVGLACQDALKFIKQFDSPQTFFYCDPPYPGTDQGHYAGYKEEDLANLANTLNSCMGSAIVSCYPHDHLFEGWEKVEISAFSSATSNGRVGIDRSKKMVLSNKYRTEVIYIKKASVQPRKEIIDLYQSGGFDCFI